MKIKYAIFVFSKKKEIAKMSIKRLHSRYKSYKPQDVNRMTNAFEAEGQVLHPHFSPEIDHPSSDYAGVIEKIKQSDAKLGLTFERLNQHQRHAVFNPAQNTILSAMVGSGKTTVLIAKIFYLHFIKHIPFEQLMVLTFTNKAAREIKERINLFTKDILSIRNNELRYFGTFHGVARQILEEHPLLEKEGFHAGFLIMDEQEKQDFLERIIVKENLNIKYHNQLISRWKKYRDTGDTTMGNMKSEDDFIPLTDFFEKEKRNRNTMDFDDLITLANKLLKNKIQNSPKWIIVDEFQDCNDEQLQFIEHFRKQNSGVFVVGDPNQSIYGWRGSVDHLFETVYSNWNATWMELPHNYRSTENILSAAQSLLSKDKTELIATRQGGTKIDLIRHFDDQQEAYYLREQLLSLTKENVTLDNMAILFRTHQQIKIVETVLSQARIPFQLTKKTELQDDPAQSFLLRIFKLCINPNDQDACLSILFDKTFGAVNRNKKAIQEITTYKEGLNALRKAVIFLENKKESHNSIIKLLNQIEKFGHAFIQQTEATSKELIDFLELQDVFKPTSIHHQEYLKSTSEAWEQIQRYRKEQGWGDPLSTFHIAIGQIVLEGSFYINDRIKVKKNGVHLLTIHAAKGLEFDRVYIAGANSGLIPLTQHQKGGQDLKEEKRLLFVAMTRSKNHLEIGWHSQPTMRLVEAEPSYFLNAISDDLLNRKNSASPEEEKEETALTETDEWQLNMQVKHGKYGIGTIVSLDENELICQFNSVGEKSFVRAFAKALLSKA